MATVKHVASHARVRHGYSAPYRRKSPHDGALCHIYPDVAPSRRSPVPTMACRYGPQVAGPTRQEEPGRRRKPDQPDLREADLQQAASSFLEAHAPLTR